RLQAAMAAHWHAVHAITTHLPAPHSVHDHRFLRVWLGQLVMVAQEAPASLIGAELCSLIFSAAMPVLLQGGAAGSAAALLADAGGFLGAAAGLPPSMHPSGRNFSQARRFASAATQPLLAIHLAAQRAAAQGLPDRELQQELQQAAADLASQLPSTASLRYWALPQQAEAEQAELELAAASCLDCTWLGCGNVDAPGGKPKRCSGCRVPAYCSPECQLAAWKAPTLEAVAAHRGQRAPDSAFMALHPQD
ncbi:hypothetical protein ABPG75_000909, partial [Micractinium tetrahymenae]